MREKKNLPRSSVYVCVLVMREKNFINVSTFFGANREKEERSWKQLQTHDSPIRLFLYVPIPINVRTQYGKIIEMFVNQVIEGFLSLSLFVVYAFNSSTVFFSSWYHLLIFSWFRFIFRSFSFITHLFPFRATLNSAN